MATYRLKVALPDWIDADDLDMVVGWLVINEHHRDAAGWLAARMGPEMADEAWYLLRNLDLAREACSLWGLAVTRRIATLESGRSVHAWGRGVLLKCVQEVRRGQRRRMPLAEPQAVEAVEGDNPRYTGERACVEDRNAVARAVAELPDETRAVVEKRFEPERAALSSTERSEWGRVLPKLRKRVQTLLFGAVPAPAAASGEKDASG